MKPIDSERGGSVKRTDEREVLKIVHDYMKGCSLADDVLLRSVFHEKAVVNGFFDSKLIAVSPSHFIQEIISNPLMDPVKEDYQLTVEQVYVMDDIASVIVTHNTDQGERKLVDCFHLIRDDGLWYITSKLFSNR